MIEAFLSVLAAGLSLWDHEEKTKYRDKYLELRKKWYEEFNKPEDIRSDAVLDNIELELRLIGEAFSTSVIGKNTKV
jgi:hypothetical protein